MLPILLACLAGVFTIMFSPIGGWEREILFVCCSTKSNSEYWVWNYLESGEDPWEICLFIWQAWSVVEQGLSSGVGGRKKQGNVGGEKRPGVAGLWHPQEAWTVGRETTADVLLQC